MPLLFDLKKIRLEINARYQESVDVFLGILLHKWAPDNCAPFGLIFKIQKLLGTKP